MKIHESIVRDTILKEFPVQGPGSLISYVAHFAELPITLALAHLFWPTIVENDGMVFLAEFYPEQVRTSHENPFSATEMEHLEQVANAVSLGLLFRSERLDILENEKLLDAFGTTLQFFWSLRLKELFPEKKFSVELGMNSGGEEGIAITFYQRRT